MSPTTIKVTFTGLSWDENPIKASRELPLKITYVTMERKFDTDEMRGWGIAAYIMTYHATNPKEATFEGEQVFEGTLLGKTGSFAASSTGVYANGVAKSNWTIIPDTATGELKGIRGHGGYETGHADPTAPIPCELHVEFE
ncbi:uncharacterized protein LOC62_03G004270 [Vanrija pseudolonga]|uniref:DUF3224 domain-containing protein n=1 Tax=Vanrija pseudolonga TaxID=143232 RepID=A0AAF0YAD2_9TREE|nr:hypothetical protein LOC62_03G004270 [Vanrija pseudolonga]